MKFIHLSLVLSCFLLGTGCFNIGTSSRQLPFDSTASNNVGITSDIEFLGEGKGKSSQIKILRFFTVWRKKIAPRILGNITTQCNQTVKRLFNHDRLQFMMHLMAGQMHLLSIPSLILNMEVFLSF